jgi:uncharacterized repeat protein (TIGR03803 family)
LTGFHQKKSFCRRSWISDLPVPKLYARLPARTPCSKSVSTWAVAALFLPLVLGHICFAQTVAEVYSFNEQGGPEFVTPAQGRDGRLYGTDGCGGIMSGFIFATTTAGSLIDLHDFNPAGGFCPNAGLTLATDGSFYGTMLGGGNNQNGVLFKITPKGTYTVLHFFAAEPTAVALLLPLLKRPTGRSTAPRRVTAQARRFTNTPPLAASAPCSSSTAPMVRV